MPKWWNPPHPPALRLHLKNITPPSCRSTEVESSGSTYAANAPLRQWRVGLRASVYGLVLDFPMRFVDRWLGRWRRKKVVQRHLRHQRVGYVPTLCSGSNGYGLFLTIVDISILPFFFYLNFAVYFGFFIVVAMATKASLDQFVFSWWWVVIRCCVHLFFIWCSDPVPWWLY